MLPVDDVIMIIAKSDNFINILLLSRGGKFLQPASHLCGEMIENTNQTFSAIIKKKRDRVWPHCDINKISQTLYTQ